jgi:hypothetical protein
MELNYDQDVIKICWIARKILVLSAVFSENYRFFGKNINNSEETNPGYQNEHIRKSLGNAFWYR